MHTDNASRLQKYPLNCESNKAPSLNILDRVEITMVSSITNIVYINLHRFCNAHIAHLARLFSTVSKM